MVICTDEGPVFVAGPWPCKNMISKQFIVKGLKCSMLSVAALLFYLLAVNSHWPYQLSHAKLQTAQHQDPSIKRALAIQAAHPMYIETPSIQKIQNNMATAESYK